MSRTVKCFTFAEYPQGLINATHDFLVSEGYTYKERKGEKVYQKGMGLMTAPSFIKVTVEKNFAKIEAWIKVAILPGVYAGEDDLKSFVGVAVKGPLKKRFAYLENIMLQFGGCPVDENIYRQPMYCQPANQPINYPQQVSQPVGQNICKSCGSALEADARFCAVCGSRTH